MSLQADHTKPILIYQNKYLYLGKCAFSYQGKCVILGGKSVKKSGANVPFLTSANVLGASDTQSIIHVCMVFNKLHTMEFIGWLSSIVFVMVFTAL